MAQLDLSDSLIACVIGHPIAQSLSPVMHNRWLEDAGIDGQYKAFDIPTDQLAEFCAAVRLSQLAGFNVTIPHKEAIIPYLDRIAPMARRIGAVNTVKRDADGSLVGFNTDGLGWLAHHRASAPGWRTDMPALILGAGGAARAILTTLLTTDIPMIMLANRNRARADALAADVGQGRVVVLNWQERHQVLNSLGLLVNTTSLGMEGQPALDMDISHLDKLAVVNDIIYKPKITTLLADAAASGHFTVGGLGMLVHQGAAAFKIWFGPDREPATSADFFAMLEGYSG